MLAKEIEIEGVLERIVFFNEENFYCIGQLKASGQEFGKANITITGILPAVECGQTLKIRGEWVKHSAYGMQIKVISFEAKLPSSIYGIEKFLGSGLIDGIGKGYAKKIVDKFGEQTIKIIDEESGRLKEIKGLGLQRIKKIKASWQEQKTLRNIIMFLRTYGVSMGMCVRIIKRYGQDAEDVVRNKPYELVKDIDGIGFKTSDKIALNIGISNESPQRIKAGILYVFDEYADAGNTCVSKAELLVKTAFILEVDASKCAQGVDELLLGGDLVLLENSLLQKRIFFLNELKIANSLNLINSSESILPSIKVDIAVEWAKERAGFDFAQRQKDAIISAISNKVSVITGGPGTGKTTILKAICQILKAKKVNVVLAAPTGRASQRMADSCGESAKTIHRLLGFNEKGFAFGVNKKLQGDFFIIDEASMLDTKLAASLFSAIPESAHVLLVGDIDQLPSVSAGNVLKDIINSNKFSVIALNEIFRQSKQSSIVHIAHSVLNGTLSSDSIKFSDLDDLDCREDFHFINTNSPSDCLQTCIKLIKDKIPAWYNVDPIWDVQVLLPMHKGEGGIANFNDALRNSLNKANLQNAKFTKFALADKVMQMRNNYDLDLFNGDIGTVVDTKKSDDCIVVDFDKNKAILTKNDLYDIELSYAMSIHKSQGSEFPIVVLPLLRQHFIMLQRNLLYTALTRAKKKIFIVGDARAWDISIKNKKASVRKTNLKEKFYETKNI